MGSRALHLFVTSPFVQVILSELTLGLQVIFLLYATLKNFVKERQSASRMILKNSLLQVYFSGYQALPVITIISIALGGVFLWQMVALFGKFGFAAAGKKLMLFIMVREILPLFTAVILIGRSGTAITAELSTMKLNRETDALTAMGINLHHFLIFPRFAGMTVAFISLSVYANAVAIFTGFFFLQFSRGFGGAGIMKEIVSSITLSDIFFTVVKICSFGVVISLVSCLSGLSVKKSFTEIPQVITKAFVSCTFLIFLVDILVALMFGTKG